MTLGKVVLFAVGLLLSLAGHAAVSGKRECRFSQGPSIEANVFEPANWPVVDLDTFSAGRLGIIRPTFDHFYLFIAYRKLLDLPVELADLERLRNHDPCWQDGGRDTHGYKPDQTIKFQETADLWVKARSAVTSNRVNVAGMGAPVKGAWEFLNCTADAFRQATMVLEDRRKRYGLGPELRDWVGAQDQVFAGCKNVTPPPSPVSADAPRWLQMDRDYQIAAARFYAGDYIAAVQEFDRIAATPDSPWREIAPYLAARALIRLATTEQSRTSRAVPDAQKLELAEKRLLALTGSSIGTELRRDSGRLLQFVQIRTRPRQMLLQIEKRIASRALPESIGQDIRDFWDVFRAAEQGDDAPFTRWLDAIRSAAHSAGPSAVDTWRSTKSVPWLVAALQAIESGDPATSELLHAASKVPETSPAFVTVRYHMARLEQEASTAIRVIKTMLSQPRNRLPPQDANAFRRVGLTRATTLDEFLLFAPREPAIAWPGVIPNVDSDAERVLNEGLPLDALASAAMSPRTNEKLRSELVNVALTRAFVMRRWDVVDKLLPSLKAKLPAEAALIGDMQNAGKENERQAIGAMLLARYPGIAGNVTARIHYTPALNEIAWPNMHRYMSQDDSRENWWWRFQASANLRALNSPRTPAGSVHATFLSTQQVSQLQIERQRLDAVSDATDYLTSILMTWAKQHPRDSRLPQGLHMLVRAPRGGCGEGNPSRALFRHLHKHFPGNPWTRRTPYHYGC